MIVCGEILTSISDNFASQSVFLTKPRTLTIFFSTTLRAAIVSKPVII